LQPRLDPYREADWVGVWVNVEIKVTVGSIKKVILPTIKVGGVAQW